ncbi:MAG: hypothetical protein H0U60_20000 [Blastocatellia bacterium]|nr:hypothetical protein [Blastocatellia bacterium]
MQVIVKQILETQQKTSKAGKAYTVTTFQGEDDKLYKDMFGKFEVGQSLEGEWKDTEYGLKFEVVKPAFSGSGGRQDNPETQAAIIRQNSLTNAVNYVLGKAAYMTQEEAIKFISGKEVIEVATYFAKYSKGEITVVTESKKPAAVNVDTAPKEHDDLEGLENYLNGKEDE